MLATLHLGARLLATESPMTAELAFWHAIDGDISALAHILQKFR